MTLPVRLIVDKNGMLQESFLELEVVQEYAGAGRGERITLGNVKLNLAEYVEQSDQSPVDGDDPGVTRRYLMQESKINSTLKLGIYRDRQRATKTSLRLLSRLRKCLAVSRALWQASRQSLMTTEVCTQLRMVCWFNDADCDRCTLLEHQIP
jgi:hypothetical protein